MVNPAPIGDITLEQLKTENVRLKRELAAAMLTVDKCLKDLSQKNEKLTHLESLVSQTVPLLKAPESKLITAVTPDEEIASLQLERLRQAARSRTLTLEEIRAYDLLVKNKRLVSNESTSNLKGNYRDVSDVELMKLAETNSDHE